jgi:RNA polymerase sigma-70 factor (ECF subfamily)
MVVVLHEQASDSALVVAVARRNETALSELHRRHAGAVNGLALKITRDATFAEEITQEVFVRLWQQPERFDAERGSLRAFLLTTAHGRSVDVVRSESSRRKREERDFVSTPETFDASPEGEIMAKALGDDVKAALRELSEGERKAVELAYFGGYSYREVAELLDEPEGTVKSRIRSGLRQLKKELAGAVDVH